MLVKFVKQLDSWNSVFSSDFSIMPLNVIYLQLTEGILDSKKVCVILSDSFGLLSASEQT